MDVTTIEENDIVQITDEAHHWFPSLIVVSELKSWGIRGFAFIPSQDGTGRAYTQLEKGKFEKVGSAVIVSGDE
jgi:hypothetical protein